LLSIEELSNFALKSAAPAEFRIYSTRVLEELIAFTQKSPLLLLDKKICSSKSLKS
jgi:hypothetical protein